VIGLLRRLLPAAAALAVAAGLSACGGDSMTVTAVFDDVGDLQPRHSVQVADVRVGRIKSIQLTDDYKARVSLSIDPDSKIPADSTALVRTTSLLGEKFVEIRANGNPTEGPFLRDGSVIDRTGEAPELEFVAQDFVTVLGAVNASDIATLAETGAQAFGERGPELRSLIDDLSTIGATFASRTSQITSVIDNFDLTAGTLAAGSGDVDQLLRNLATTSQVLADNRGRTITALDQLSRLAAVQNSVLGRYRSDIDRQIKQADAIVGEAAKHTGELSQLVDWLEKFAVGTPKTIPKDFTQVYMWVVPAEMDPRVEQ
jgi:phospholipid/cholesterol/gamma-HCH transport system substrate-binding protein